MEQRAGRRGTDEVEQPPLRLLEEEVGVARVGEQPRLQEGRVRGASRGHFRLLPLMEVPLLLVGDRLADEAGEEQAHEHHRGETEPALMVVGGQCRKCDEEQKHVLEDRHEEHVEDLELPRLHPGAHVRPPVVLHAGVAALAGEVEGEPCTPQRDHDRHDVQACIVQPRVAGEHPQVHGRDDRPDAINLRVVLGDHRQQPRE